MKKSLLRTVFKEKRNKLSTTERSKLDDLLLIQFQKTEIPFIQSLLSFWPIEEHNEPDTHLFTDYVEFRNPELILAYPRTDFMLNEMVAVVVNPKTDFIKNEYNIFEPAEGDILPADEIDLIFIPLLAIDKKGYRVGYGKGFYDRYLPECKKESLKVGFSYFEPVDEITDKDEFDVPLDLCITPHNIYVF